LHEKSKALELKIDNLVQVGAKDKNYNFTNARVDVYPDKLKPNIFTLTLNKAQDKVFQRYNNLYHEAWRQSHLILYTLELPLQTLLIVRLFQYPLNHKVFDAILVEVTKTIGSKKYKLKRNTGTSAIVISDKELTPEL
jgi:hypothetical protein